MAYLSSFESFENLILEIVSDFDIRISDLSSTFVENPLQIDPFMQNEPNFTKCPNGPKSLFYNELRTTNNELFWEKRTQNEPNFSSAPV